MRLITLLAMAASASSLALPQTDGGDGGGISRFPANTSVTYWQGSAPPNACMFGVGSGTLQAEACQAIRWNGLSIAQQPSNNCSLTLYKGTTTCDAPTETTTFPVPAGNDSTCVYVGVLDGGKFQKASCVWSCA